MFVKCTDGSCDLVLASHDGSAIRFSEENVRPMGRTARGVRGISLREGDTVAGVAVADDSKWLITVTENGYGKRTPFSDLRTMRNRGGLGVICHNLTEKTGLLAGIATVDEQDDIMMITDQGTIVRTPVADINIYSRSASGVIVMRLGEGQKLVTFTKVAREDEAAEEAEEIAEADTEVVEITEEVEVVETVENTPEN
jgi:DNA gyrase subunit A